jgi:hypothetical protein
MRTELPETWPSREITCLFRIALRAVTVSLAGLANMRRIYEEIIQKRAYQPLCWPPKEPSECKKLRAFAVVMLKTGHLETGQQFA